MEQNGQEPKEEKSVSGPEPDENQNWKWRAKHWLWKNKPHNCVWCGRFLSFTQATIDHLVPKSKGGSNSGTNLGLACIGCNKRKGNKIWIPKHWIQKYFQLFFEPTNPSNPAPQRISRLNTISLDSVGISRPSEFVLNILFSNSFGLLFLFRWV